MRIRRWPVLVDLVMAARPNFMKVAPLFHELRRADWCRTRLIHTGQHYDVWMSDAVLADLSMPPPDVYLGIGSGTHAEQTAGTMLAYERLCLEDPPDLVLVVGDVNATVACALAAKKLGLPVAHLEAGLRSRDLSMPEEINRIVTDSISDLLLTPSPDADENLAAEGRPAAAIVRVGNIMIDSFEMLRPRIEATRSGLPATETIGSHGVVTLHRPANVDDPNALGIIVDALVGIAREHRLLFPVHPRTERRLHDHGLWHHLASHPAIVLSRPLGYIEFMARILGASFVITDSGGVQEETTYLGIPCLTLRENTERPITLTQGTNRLVRPLTLAQAVIDTLANKAASRPKPDLWDGRTAARVAACLRAALVEDGTTNS